jgi:hypothetical protein
VVDYQGDAWKLVDKGTCETIALPGDRKGLSHDRRLARKRKKAGEPDYQGLARDLPQRTDEQYIKDYLTPVDGVDPIANL